MKCIWSAIRSQDITLSDPKSWFLSSIHRFFDFFTRDSHRSRLHVTCGMCFFRLFSASFCQNVDGVFLEITIIPPPPGTKKKVSGNRFVLLLRKVYTIVQIENRKLSWENAGKYPRDYSWTSSHCTKGLCRCRCTELITFQGGHSLDHLIGSRNKEHSYAAIAVLSDRIGYDRME